MQDVELCRELLQRILPDLEIDHIEYPELQKAIRPDADAKSVRLEEAVKEAKKNREWRHEYMTLLMGDQENIEKGIQQGIKALIFALKDFDIEDNVIVQKI